MAGTPMVFVRFGGCHIRCDYCDTPGSLEFGSGKEMTPEEIRRQVRTVRTVCPPADPPLEWISLTGGEPLAHVRFLEKLLPLLKEDAWKIYLETDGLLPQNLSRVRRWIDQISMDIKLPSSIGFEPWEAHERFLRIAAGKSRNGTARSGPAGGREESSPEIFVKIVVTENTTEAEVVRAGEIVRKFRPDSTVVLQPATAVNGVRPPSYAQVIRFREILADLLSSADATPARVFAMPQLHPKWGLP